MTRWQHAVEGQQQCGILAHVCRLIREFEKEARTDDVRPSEIAARKRELTEQLNDFLDMKKQHAATAQSRAQLLGSRGAAADDTKHSRHDSA